MWFEGTYQNIRDIDKNTEAFFKRNEHLKKDYKGVDPLDLKTPEHPTNIIDDTYMPWIQVPLNVPWKDIYEEANHLLYTSCYTLHRPNSSGWLSLAVHGMSSVHTNVPSDYNLPDSAEEDLSDWTDIAKFCPRTVEWMKDEMLYDTFSRVRFMALLPGGWLGAHRDRPTTKGMGATNVAINNPDGCALVMEEWGTMPFEPGTVFKINTGYEHAVWNRSEEPRIHMIFDGEPSHEFLLKTQEGYVDMIENGRK